MDDRPKNRLATASSPYLLQHASNPVDWYPWGTDALEAAHDRNVPVFLSVGYAACHWCHVMERESFEDRSTAAYLNEHFVSIKVDREERPDVDAIYMDAVQAMTGSGGWPMSIFLTPDGKPFYAGTYFPDTPRHGMPSFRQVLEGIEAAWHSRRDDVEAQGSQVAEAIRRAATSADEGTLDPSLDDDAFSTIAPRFDPRWGGFGGAPKFPQPTVLRWLLRQHLRGRPGALEMVTTTLDRMANGGIDDQVGGGFYRYSTDDRWLVPHFEKMLSDNAQLLQLYVEGWQVTRNDHFRVIARRTAAYLMRELQQPGGGFSSSQDADSDGVEGAFYTWSWDALLASMEPATAEALGASPEGNWDGVNVLWRPESSSAIADRQGLSALALDVDLERALEALFRTRSDRVAPTVDDKVVAAWNGLTIGALAIAGRALDAPTYVEAAIACAGFLLAHLRPDGRLVRTWRDGRSSADGFLDDYALVGNGLLRLYEATGDTKWFREAEWCATEILHRFGDPDDDGFFLTADDADPLVVRPREVVDTATPSGSAAAAELLTRLALFTGDRELEDAASRTIRGVANDARRHPLAFAHTLGVADLLRGPNQQIAIVGPEGHSLDVMRQTVDARFMPNAVLAVGTDVGRNPADIVPLLHDRSATGSRVTAFVCERFVCAAPTTDPATLAASLASTEHSALPQA
jgi:uncharacterized protein YyaL (SSP411 family)